MRREWRWALIAGAALALGALCAQPYARLLAPYYLGVGRLIAQGYPWEIVSVEVATNANTPGSVLRLSGLIRRHETDSQPVGRIVSKLQVAAVAESPVVFWTLLLVWPLGLPRQRLRVLLLGIPIFLGLEAATTVCQLLNPLAYGSAILAGNPDPLTLWERWSRFVESGGRVALALSAATLTVTAGRLFFSGPGTALQAARQ